MGLLNSIFNSSDSIKKEISQVVAISDCPAECSDCTSKFPSSLKFQDDDGSSLWKNTKPFALHCVVPTSKADWPRDATTTPSGTLQSAVDAWASNSKSLAGGNIKVSVSSLPLSSDSSTEYIEMQKGDVLLLPYFVWVKGCPISKVEPVLNKLIPILREKSERKEANLPNEIEGVEISPSNMSSYVFLCSHRTRDKRCGITAPIMKSEMDSYLRELDLLRDFGDDRPNGVQVTFINHIGGHKFAANVIVYLKSGEMIWLARCNPKNVKPIVDECIIGGGKVWPEKVRLVQKTDAVSW